MTFSVAPLLGLQRQMVNTIVTKYRFGNCVGRYGESRHLHAGTEEDHEQLASRCSICRPRQLQTISSSPVRLLRLSHFVRWIKTLWQ